MDLVDIIKLIKKYGFIILGTMILILILTFFISTNKKNEEVLNTNNIFSSIGPISGNIPQEKFFQTQKMGDRIFSTDENPTNGNITYFKYDSSINSYYEYFMKSPKYYNGKDINNPIYLGYYLSYEIYNIPYPSNPSELINYKVYLIDHFYSIPHFLYADNSAILSTLSNNYSKFALVYPSLENFKIIKYLKDKEYIVQYKYLLTADSSEGRAGYLTRSMNVTLKEYNNQWKAENIKL